MEAIVPVTGGKVRGTTRDGIATFLGIPYAAAPVGPARFELPTRVPEWDGVRDALAYGATCVQSPYPAPIHALLGSDGIPGDDYLNLNVWTPDTGGSGLPVLVWIHGGAFVRGSNSRPIYDGGSFARDGVVTVSINYRLGVSGFAAIADAPLNRGLHDQVFALRWVQENIAAFGGDPGNVTVFGESAGGMSIAALIASPVTKGLFRRAIIQSGNGIGIADAQDAGKVAAAVAGKAGIAPTAAAFGELGPDRLRAAQDAMALDLMLDPDPARWGETVIGHGLGVMSLFPVVDGDLVEDLSSAVLAARPDRAVPLLIGCTAEEFRFFTVPAGLAAGITDRTLPAVLRRYGLDPAVAQVYSANRPEGSAADVFNAIITDVAFREDSVRIAESVAAAGEPAYMYEFAWRSGADGLGACHVLEVPFVFDRLDAAPALTGPNPPQALADRVHRAWVDFATHGDPGWTRLRAGERAVQIFDDPSSQVRVDPRADELTTIRTWREAQPS